MRILLRSSTCIITLKERNPYVQFYKLCCDQETIRLLTCENPEHKGEGSQGVFRSCKEFTKLVENLKWVIFGSIAKVQIVWDIADLFMALMAIINLIAIAKLSKFAFAALKDYTTQKKKGQDPVFYSSSIEGLTNTECWENNSSESLNA